MDELPAEIKEMLKGLHDSCVKSTGIKEGKNFGISILEFFKKGGKLHTQTMILGSSPQETIF